MKRGLLLAAIALPPAAVAAWSIASPSPAQGWVTLAIALALSAAIARVADARTGRRLSTVSAVLAAYREGDFSIRPKRTAGDGPAAELLGELAALGESLRTQRLGELEAWTLLRKVLAEVDVVVVAVDDGGRIRLANEAAARMLERTVKELVGKDAAAVGLGGLDTGEVPRLVKIGDGQSPWELRRGTFRLEGVNQTLVVLSDVTRTLRDNERDAWRRLIRVIGHEINNSLTPIKSIAESLASLLDVPERPADWETDVRAGLVVVARRAEGLNRFMASYARLARLPPPSRSPVDLGPLVAKAAALETRVPVDLAGGPPVTMRADADQLEQALINLIKNAAEASIATNGRGVRVAWRTAGTELELSIEDDGPGVADTANLFVPFFTTKPGGSGVGLVLSRQIVEGHDGTLTLASRPGGPGAIALVRLPIE